MNSKWNNQMMNAFKAIIKIDEKILKKYLKNLVIQKIAQSLKDLKA